MLQNASGGWISRTVKHLTDRTGQIFYLPWNAAPGKCCPGHMRPRLPPPLVRTLEYWRSFNGFVSSSFYREHACRHLIVAGSDAIYKWMLFSRRIVVTAWYMKTVVFYCCVRYTETLWPACATNVECNSLWQLYIFLWRRRIKFDAEPKFWYQFDHRGSSY